MLSSENIKNEVLTINSEHSSYEYHCEIKPQATLCTYDLIFGNKKKN